MFKNAFCLPFACFSRADIFCTTFIGGIVLFCLGLVLLAFSYKWWSSTEKSKGGITNSG